MRWSSGLKHAFMLGFVALAGHLIHMLYNIFYADILPVLRTDLAAITLDLEIRVINATVASLALQHESLVDFTTGIQAMQEAALNQQSDSCSQALGVLAEHLRALTSADEAIIAEAKPLVDNALAHTADVTGKFFFEYKASNQSRAARNRVLGLLKNTAALASDLESFYSLLTMHDARVTMARHQYVTVVEQCRYLDSIFGAFQLAAKSVSMLDREDVKVEKSHPSALLGENVEIVIGLF